MSDSGLVLNRFELPVKDEFLVEPDNCLYPLQFYVENDKLYMDAVIVRGERPFSFYVHMLKAGKPIPEKLLEHGAYFGGLTVKGVRYFLFLTEA